MKSTKPHQNIDYLRNDQYKDSRNLGDRAQLHTRFGDNPIEWSGWIFDFLNLMPDSGVLECGAGPGWLWRSNLDRIPAGCQVILTDLSLGMVQEAEEFLANNAHDFSFREANITSLPFGTSSFDLVIANHMLYHVPDLEKALSEVKRVLKPGGVFVASTVGQGHMREIRELGAQLSPELAARYQSVNFSFTLENGRVQLEPWFSNIELHHYKNVLKVTEVDPILSYALSSSEARAQVDESSIKLATQTLESIIAEQGFFKISTNAGLFKSIN